MSRKNRNVVWTGIRGRDATQVEVQETPYPEMKYPWGDACTIGAIIKIIGACLCGSDLHFLGGFCEEEPGKKRIGHEPFGEIVECGAGVTRFKVGDWVSLGFNVACGFCEKCKPQWGREAQPHLCTTFNPGRYGAAWGYPGLGDIDGAQADYMFVPNIDYMGVKVDKDAAISGKKLRDICCLSDIGPTGFHAVARAGVTTNSRVWLAGAGPVGLSCGLGARALGASYLFITDRHDGRLANAKAKLESPTMKVETCNIQEGDGVMTSKMQKFMGITTHFCDAVGLEACSHGHGGTLQPATVLNQAHNNTVPGGTVTCPGAYFRRAPAAEDADAQMGRLGIDAGEQWDRALTHMTGQTPVLMYQQMLLDMVMADQYPIADVVNATVFPLEDVQDAYDSFGSGEAMKPIVDPHGIMRQHA